MFNFFKSSEEKREEQISAYIDQQMTAAERQSFETLLAGDADLREQVEGQQEVKTLLTQMPKLKAPRNFVLDPSVYGGKAPAPSLLEMLYPKMRLATAAAAFLFVVIFGAGVLLPNASFNNAPAADIAMAPLSDLQAESIEEADIVVARDAMVIEPEVEATEIQSREFTGAAEGEAMADDEVVPLMSQAENTADSDEGAASLQLEIEEANAIESPRLEESEAIEGERVSEPEPIPSPTVKVGSDEVAAAPVEETIDLTSEDDFARSGAREAGTNWLVIGLWVFGILTIALILSTFIIGRRMDE